MKQEDIITDPAKITRELVLSELAKYEADFEGDAGIFFTAVEKRGFRADLQKWRERVEKAEDGPMLSTVLVLAYGDVVRASRLFDARAQERAEEAFTGRRGPFSDIREMFDSLK